ncbi:hypothetical protein AAG747_14605 [Rapidithrix thailandica]|uniref:Uncharacterized protein n=1 Tax=Rapidithrix thailandica TaxID=413964 RepID=A0AAW9S813_9BACT
MEEENKKKRQRTALLITLLVDAAVIAVLIFVVAWRAPDPPIPQYGIEVNFGTMDFGSGDIQNQTTPNNNESMDKAKPDVETPPTEEPTEDPVQEPQPSPDPVTEDPTPEETPTEVPPVADESEESVETVEEMPEPDPVPDKPKEEKPKVNQETVLKPVPGSKDNNTGTANENQANNNGNQNKTGDQGKKEGNLNADALLGSTGSGGAALDMPGWNWDEMPNVVDNSRETGYVEFEIKIDDEGEVISVKTLKRSVTSTVANVYKKEVENLTFSPVTGDNPPAFTVGRIRFTITSR